MSKRLWMIEVRGPRQKIGYPMDSMIFEKKIDAIRYRDEQGSSSWHKDWHVVELVRRKPHDR